MLSLKEPNETILFGRSPFGLPIIVRKSAVSDNGKLGDSSWAASASGYDRAKKLASSAAVEVRRRSSDSPVLEAPERKSTF